MGEYARINKQIADQASYIEELRAKLEATPDGPEHDTILEAIYDLQIGIGECRGALLEMAEVDGLDDYNEAFDYE